MGHTAVLAPAVWKQNSLIHKQSQTALFSFKVLLLINRQPFAIVHDVSFIERTALLLLFKHEFRFSIPFLVKYKLEIR